MRIVKKLAAFLASLFILSLAVFWIARLAPGDPLVSYYGERAERLSPAQRAQAEAQLGLDAPIHEQYARWLNNALHGDLGISFQYKQDVLTVIRDRIGNTLLLGGLGFALIFCLSPALGLLCARFEDRLPDKILCKLGTISSCIPEFWLGMLLILVFSVTLRWLPSAGAWSIGPGGGTPADRARHLVLPLAVVVTGHLWYYAYMIRNMLSEQMRMDYVLLARSTGLSRGRVLAGHCLRNVLPAYLSVMAVGLPHILGGTYVVEMVFSYPGIGTLAYESARYRDYDLLMVLCLLTGAAVLAGNMLAQAVNERLDPRIRAREAVRPDRRGEGAADRG